jgi:DNA ligase-1
VYGSYLLAIYSEETEEFQTISKIGTGFSEEQLISLSALLNTFTIPSPHSYYKYALFLHREC